MWFLTFLWLFAYGATLSFPFVYDDYAYIHDNPAVQRLRWPQSYFFNPGLLAADNQLTYDNYRPLTLYTLALTHAIGGMRPAAFRAVNLLLHLLNSLLLFLWMRREDIAEESALCGAAIFLLHPVQIESVVWLSSRSTGLAAAFFLGSCLLYGNGARAVGFILFVLGLISKESVIMLPLVLVLWEGFRTSHSWSKIVQRTSPFFAAALAFILWRIHILGRIGQTAYLDHDAWVSALTSFKALCVYMKLLLIPFPLSLAYDIAPVRHLWDPWTIPALFLLAAAGIWMWKNRRAQPLVVFGLLTAAANFLPVLNIIPIKAVLADRFLYFPLMGLVFALAARLPPKSLTSHKKAITLIAIYFGLLSGWRLWDWADAERLFRHSLWASPGNIAMHFGLALEESSRGDVKDARDELEICVRLDPRHADAWLDLARLDYLEGRYTSAAQHAEHVLNLRRRWGDLYEAAVAFRLGGRSAQANQMFQIILNQQPDFAPARRELRLGKSPPTVPMSQLISESLALDRITTTL